MASRLQREIRQSRPFASPAEEALLSIVRTAEHLRAQAVPLLRTHELSPPQYNVLRILRGAGTDGHPCQEIGARMIARVPDVTRLVDRLEAAGLVERARTDADRRVVRVRITRPGTELLARLEEPMRQLTERLLAPLRRKEQEQLTVLLARLREP